MRKILKRNPLMTASVCALFHPMIGFRGMAARGYFALIFPERLMDGSNVRALYGFLNLN